MLRAMGLGTGMLIVMVMIARRLEFLSRHAWHAFPWASFGDKYLPRSGITTVCCREMQAQQVQGSKQIVMD